MSAILRLHGLFRGAGIRLADEAAAEGATWVQVAAGGQWKGHANFEQVTFDEAFFNKVVANFRVHPSYEAGDDGKGKARVVPFDYEHASEAPATAGTIPLTGAPAAGWVLELEVRKGEEGGVELWALAEFLPNAREQIRAGSYRWTSVAIWPNAVDKVSGKKRGPVLTSVALTNRPFIEGMAPLKARVEVYGRAESAEEFIVGLREILELPAEADAAQAQTGLTELVDMYANGMKPPGYPDGVGYLLNQVRRLLGLRALAMPDEIVSAAGQALGALSASPPKPAETPPPPPPEVPAMSDKLRQALITLFDVRDNDEAILAAATKGAGALSRLGELMKEFGASDPGDLATKATAARDNAAKVADFAGKLNEALAALADGTEEEVKEETEMVAASVGAPAATDPRGKAMRRVIFSDLLDAKRAALGLVVATDAEGKRVVTLGAKDPSKLIEFRQNYPTQDPKKVLLTQPIAAGSHGQQLGGQHTALPGAGGAQPNPTEPQHPEHIAALSSYPGENNVQRAIALLSEKQPGFRLLDWGRQNYLAGRYLNTGKAA